MSHTAACFKIVNHESYCFESHAAVTIWKPAYKSTHKATRAKSHNTQLIKFLTHLINPPPSAPLCVHAHLTAIPCAELV